MIGWLIVFGILALLLGLLLTPLLLAVDYDDPKNRFFWKLSWLGISLACSEKPGLFQKNSSSKQTKPKPQTGRPEETKRKKAKRYWNMLHDSIALIPRPLRLLWKGISLRKLVIAVQVGRFDAKECALAYGAVNAMLYGGVGLLKSVMRVKVERVSVQCAFGQDQTQWIVRGKLRFCPLAALAALFSFAVAYLMQRNRAEKKAVSEKQTAV